MLQRYVRKGWVLGAVAGVVALVLVGCQSATNVSQAAPAPAATTAAYHPQSRDFVVTTVPLLVHEQATTFGFLQEDFAKGGLLDGKEVYGFYPSTLVVYAGDTVRLTVVNPEDDPHTFTISSPVLSVNIEVKGQATASGSFVASQPGIYTFLCAEPEHAPYMWGQLIVLPASDAPQG
jgi:plastocyanin